MTTNNYERDFEEINKKLKFPGRFDPRLLQNKILEDGFPGLQLAFRNWLKYWIHEGAMDQNVDLNNKNLENVNQADIVTGNITTGNITTANITTNNVTNENVSGDLDVDGTTNLDNTDIDGTLDVSGVVDLHDNLDMNGAEIQSLLIANDKIYYVSSDAEFDAAISDIETNNYNGLIILLDDLTNVQAILNDASAGYTIDLNGHTIEANGDNTILTISAYNHLTIKNGKIDCSDLTTITNAAVIINEPSDNYGFIENIVIVGDGNHSYGIEIQSNNIKISNCYCGDLFRGIFINGGSYCTLIGNTVEDCGHGIMLLSTSNNCIINGNICKTCSGYGIYNPGDENNITGNICKTCSSGGIYNDGDEVIIVANQSRDGITNTGANTVVANNNTA